MYQDMASVEDACWAQVLNAPTPVAGTTVVVSRYGTDDGPVNLVVVEAASK
jgi:hypothetical protein